MTTEKLNLAEQILLNTTEYKTGMYDYKTEDGFLYIWSRENDNPRYLSLSIVHYFHGYMTYLFTSKTGKPQIIISF